MCIFVLFQDLNLTWNSDVPDFTVCFQRSAVVWLPCFFLWATMPIYGVYLSRCKKDIIPANWLNTSKTVKYFIFLLHIKRINWQVSWNLVLIKCTVMLLLQVQSFVIIHLKSESYLSILCKCGWLCVCQISKTSNQGPSHTVMTGDFCLSTPNT